MPSAVRNFDKIILHYQYQSREFVRLNWYNLKIKKNLVKFL